MEAIRLRRDTRVVNELKALETAIKEKQGTLRTFETSYRAAKKAFQEAVTKFEEETQELAELLSQRDETYNSISSSLMYAEPIQASSSQLHAEERVHVDDGTTAPSSTQQNRASGPAPVGDASSSNKGDAKKSWGFIPRFK